MFWAIAFGIGFEKPVGLVLVFKVATMKVVGNLVRARSNWDLRGLIAVVYGGCECKECTANIGSAKVKEARAGRRRLVP